MHNHHRLFGGLAALLLLALAACQTAATPTVTPESSPIPSETAAVTSTPTAAGTNWWDEAVFYEIFVRSFKDSDGDGVLETPQGKAIKLTLLIQSSYQRMAELMVDYLKALGMTAEIKTVDQSTWYTLKESFDYDLTLTRTTPWGMMVYANWGSAYFDSRRTGQGVLRTVDDPEYLKLCDQIMAATSKDQLEEYAHEMQDYYAKNLPAIPLYWGEVITPYNKDWTGWVSNPLYGIYNADNFLSVQKA